MMTNASPKLPAFAALGAAGCLFGLALERPEPVLLGAPFLVALVIGVALMRPFDVQVSARLLDDRVNEGDDVTLDIELASAVPVSWVEVALRLPDGLAPVEEPAANLVTLAPGVVCQLQHAIHCRRWGGYLVGEIFVRARDPLGLFVRERWVHASLPLRVYPRPEMVRKALASRPCGRRQHSPTSICSGGIALVSSATAASCGGCSRRWDSCNAIASSMP